MNDEPRDPHAGLSNREVAKLEGRAAPEDAKPAATKKATNPFGGKKKAKKKK
jgi:hypothetical protein